MIPYVEKFLEKQYADDLFEFLRTGPHFRPRNARNGTYLRRVSYYGLCWCSPGDDCHAKVWLELANAPREAENGK